MKFRLSALTLLGALALAAGPALWSASAQAETAAECKARCTQEMSQCMARAQAAIDRNDAYSIPDCNDDCNYQIQGGCASSQNYCEQDCPNEG